MNIQESCKCPACSDSLVFDIGEWVLRCPGCGAKYDIEKYDKDLRMKKEPPRDTEPAKEDMTCPGCGAALSPGIQALTMTCPGCGGFLRDITSSKGNSKDGVAPDLVIPFAHGREVFWKVFQDHCDKHPSTPDDLLGNISPENIRPAYIPVLMYELLAEGDFSWEIRNDSKKIVGYRVGDFSLNLKGFPEPLSDLPLKDPGGSDEPGSLCLETWDISRARPRRAAWFCGLRDKFGRTAPAEILRPRKSPDYEGIKKRVQDLCAWLLTESKSAKGVSGSLDITPESIRYVLCPVWLLPVSYHGRTYLSVMNASTGKATISLPRNQLKNTAIALGLSSFGTGLFAVIHLPFVMPLLTDKPNYPLIILSFVLYVPALILICNICIKSYEFCRRNLFKNVNSVLITSSVLMSAGLPMIYALLALSHQADRWLPSFWLSWLLIPFVTSLVLIADKNSFVSYELDGTAKGGFLYPDRIDFDKFYIDLRESSVQAEFQSRGNTEELPDPLAPLRSADSR